MGTLVKQQILVLFIGAAAFLAGGCSCQHTPDRHPVTVSLGAGFTRPQAIEVHIFAANAQLSPEWESVSMSKYWGASDRERAQKFREKSMYVMHFGIDRPTSQTFSPQTTPEEWKQLWATWEQQKAVKLFIFAYLPSDPSQPFEDKPGSLDARRLVIPLDKCKWENPQQPLDVTITPARIELVTQQAEKKK